MRVVLREVFPSTSQAIGSVVDEHIKLAIDGDGIADGLVDALLVPYDVQLEHRSAGLLQVFEGFWSTGGGYGFVAALEDLMDEFSSEAGGAAGYEPNEGCHSMNDMVMRVMGVKALIVYA